MVRRDSDVRNDTTAYQAASPWFRNSHRPYAPQAYCKAQLCSHQILIDTDTDMLLQVLSHCTNIVSEGSWHVFILGVILRQCRFIDSIRVISILKYTARERNNEHRNRNRNRNRMEITLHTANLRDDSDSVEDLFDRRATISRPWVHVPSR